MFFNPIIAYKETIRSAVKAEAKYAKQSGGKGQYGHAVIEMEPTEGEYSFENAIEPAILNAISDESTSW